MTSADKPGTESTGRTGPIRHLPNALSVSRILIAACFPVVPVELQLPLIVAGLITEFLDGFIARMLGAISYLGQILDPVADKLFVLSVSLTWLGMGQLTVMQWLLLASRDFGVLAIFLFLLLSGKLRLVRSPQARLPSKITTALQYGVFSLLLIGWQEFLTPAALVTGVVGLLATLQYAVLIRGQLLARSGGQG